MIGIMRVTKRSAPFPCPFDGKDRGSQLTWFFRNLVEVQVAEDHFSFEQVKRCSPKHYLLYSF